MRRRYAYLMVLLSWLQVSCAPNRGSVVLSQRAGTPPEQPFLGPQFSVRTIDPADEDWSDLTALTQPLSDARLVLLGEATHGDGATFLAKTRLIKFLHQRLGFDILVFESGFYDCSRAWPPRAGSAAAASFENCAWAIWSERQELEPLVAYLERTRTGSRPLELAGMDPDIGVPGAYEKRAHELHNLLDTTAILPLPRERITAFLDFVDHAGDYRARTLPIPSGDSLRSVVATAETLAAAVKRNEQLSRGDRGFWALVLENLAAETQARFITRMYSASPPDPAAAWEANLRRDSQMAKNLGWIMDEAYPGRKVIVWLATVHAARRLEGVSPVSDQPTPFGFSLQELFRRRRTFGDDLHDRYGSAVYAIGFTAFGGSTVGGQSGRPIVAPSSDSVEDILGRTGHDFVFLDLRHGTASSSEGLVARPFGYAEMRAADWSRTLDGLFFIRAMTASTPKQSR